MKSEIKLKNQPLSEWKNWIQNELTPPLSEKIKEDPELKYTMEAFLELITITEKLNT